MIFLFPSKSQLLMPYYLGCITIQVWYAQSLLDPAPHSPDVIAHQAYVMSKTSAADRILVRFTPYQTLSENPSEETIKKILLQLMGKWVKVRMGVHTYFISYPLNDQISFQQLLTITLYTECLLHSIDCLYFIPVEPLQCLFLPTMSLLAL